MPQAIEVAPFVDYFMLRNCIVDNLVNAQNQSDGKKEPLQFNWWGLPTPFEIPGSLPPGISVDWWNVKLRILGDILWIPAMNFPCNADVPNPVVNQFPSSVRIGTMKNRRNIMGGGYNSNF